ncbi:YceK/YidQ family lipoprotein [Sinimarinibacterium sp. CAU 1509]|uniref:YceK/YidQ family lipoprotein n=1 Tax=Sinimarinibacterium sp. CAU 1509 TaxID=2562283 RepID=UPI00146E799A|nr:YceK/YidQ family lipoprotein [Sinimarinibacterium sp. CAU 1509]
MQKSVFHLLPLGITSLLMCACSTMSSAPYMSQTSPKFFTGTRLNIAAIGEDYETLSHFGRYGMKPAKYPIVDLPLSGAFDIVLLPYIAGCAIEPFGQDFSCFAGP